VLGADGRIVAILFNGVLSSPPTADRGNKILWVARDPWQGFTDLVIRARDGDEVVTRKVPGGPGPSGVDLPHPGCWQLSLSWADQHDSLPLAYESPGQG
jgi:hypothetical protein